MKISTNEHIDLIKKWLADSDSVSQQELADNRAAAAAARAAAYAAAAADAAYAAYWVKRYEELTACRKKR